MRLQPLGHPSVRLSGEERAFIASSRASARRCCRLSQKLLVSGRLGLGRAGAGLERHFPRWRSRNVDDKLVHGIRSRNGHPLTAIVNK